MNGQCCICHEPEAPDNPIVNRQHYVGGRAYQQFAECEDEDACGARLEALIKPQPLRPEDGPALALAVERWLQEGASHAG